MYAEVFRSGRVCSPLSFDWAFFSIVAFVACQFFPVQRHLGVLDPISMENRKKPWVHSCVGCQSSDDFTSRKEGVTRKKEEMKKEGRGGKKKKTNTNVPFSVPVSTVSRSSCTTETLQRQARLSLLADNLSNCYRFLCAVGYFCLGGPLRIFHLSYVREGCYQVENLLLRGWSVRIGKTINRRYYFCRIISQSRNRRRSWSS